MEPKLYKVLGPNAESIHGGQSVWAKPSGKKPGKWMDEIKSVNCCNSGYHLVELRSLAEWLRDDCTIYLAEGRGATSTDGSGKTAYAQARLTRRLYLSPKDMRLFAADCADHVLHNWTAFAPGDKRVADCIQTVRDIANGKIADTDGYAAWSAESAAWSAAESAAWSAVRSAGSAAESAAWSAAWSAESAARSAARSAAESAVRSAWSAAGSAAGSAAWSAGSAAESAESRWQSDTLQTYLKETK